MSVNNSRGELPLVTAGEEAQFRLPLEMIWGKGQDLLWTISEYPLVTNDLTNEKKVSKLQLV